MNSGNDLPHQPDTIRKISYSLLVGLLSIPIEILIGLAGWGIVILLPYEARSIWVGGIGYYYILMYLASIAAIIFNLHALWLLWHRKAMRYRLFAGILCVFVVLFNIANFFTALLPQMVHFVSLVITGDIMRL
jgi:hypothetical protein